MFDRRLIQNFDWGLLGLTFLLAAIGLMTLYSAVTAGATDPQRILYTKQLIWFGAGLFMMIVSFLFDYKILDRWAVLIYVFGVVLLVCVLLFGKYVGGSRRWLTIGPISIQPSEMIKVVMIVVLAKYYSKMAKRQGLHAARPFVPGDVVYRAISVDRQAARPGNRHAGGFDCRVDDPVRQD